MVMVMGLWNFLLRGSTVTMGLNVALLPMIFFTVSSGTGWVWKVSKWLILFFIINYTLSSNKGKQKHGFLLDLMIFLPILFSAFSHNLAI